MEIEDYQSNSHKSKEQQSQEMDQHRAKSVVTGTTIVRKKSVGDKIRDTFIAEDLVKVKDYVVTDVIVPNIKKAIDDIVSNGIHMVLYGSGTGSRSSSSNRIHTSSSSPRISYKDYYDGRTSPSAVGSRTNFYNFDDVVFDTRGDAELVLDQLVDMLSSYGVVTVQDYYDSCGVTSDYTTCDYGWRTLKTASIARVPEGYIIRMPRAIDIRR